MKNSKAEKTAPPRALAIAAGLTAVLLFGASFVAIKIALAQVDPLVLIPIRFGLGLVVLMPLVLSRTGWRHPKRDELLRTAILGGLAIFLNQWFQAAALVTAEATTASWLSALAPAFMALLAWIFLRERIVPWQWLGILLALAGALLVSEADPSATFESGGWVAPVLLIASALAWAVFSVFGKAESTRTSPLRATVMAMLWALVFGAAISLLRGDSWNVAAWGAQTWTALIFLGVVCTGIAYALYFFALAGAQSALVAALQYLEPLVTVVIAFFLLQEQLRVISLVGGLLILMGIVLVEREGARQA